MGHGKRHVKTPSENADNCNINNWTPKKRTWKNKQNTTDETHTRKKKQNADPKVARNGKRKQLKEKRLQQKETETKTKQLEYATWRKTLIRMENGLGALDIASLDPCSMREKEIQREIEKGLTENKIHIEAIQETHITQDRSYMMGNYRIVTASSNKSAETGIVTGGTAIAIRESLRRHITQIIRQSSRSPRVALGHVRSKMHIRIITTYAPHNGHRRKKPTLGRCKRTDQQDMQATPRNLGRIFQRATRKQKPRRRRRGRGRKIR